MNERRGWRSPTARMLDATRRTEDIKSREDISPYARQVARLVLLGKNFPAALTMMKRNGSVVAKDIISDHHQRKAARERSATSTDLDKRY
jgi:hypothetical protein